MLSISPSLTKSCLGANLLHNMTKNPGLNLLKYTSFDMPARFLNVLLTYVKMLFKTIKVRNKLVDLLLSSRYEHRVMESVFLN